MECPKLINELFVTLTQYLTEPELNPRVPVQVLQNWALVLKAMPSKKVDSDDCHPEHYMNSSCIYQNTVSHCFILYTSFWQQRALGVLLYINTWNEVQIMLIIWTLLDICQMMSVLKNSGAYILTRFPFSELSGRKNTKKCYRIWRRDWEATAWLSFSVFILLWKKKKYKSKG